VQLSELVGLVVDNLRSRPQFESKNITVTTEFDPEIPSIQADQIKLMQIVTNLVDNAFNYTYPGGAIDISTRRRAEQPDQVVIAVKDTGIGIPEEFRARIWNRFERYEEHALGDGKSPGRGWACRLSRRWSICTAARYGLSRKKTRGRRSTSRCD